MSAETSICRKLSAVVGLTAEDRQIIGAILANRFDIPATSVFVREGQPLHQAHVVMQGWAYRFRMFQDGRRQISRLFLPGDFIGMNTALLGFQDQSVAALTDMVVSKFDARAFAEQLRTSPRLWVALLWSYTRDRSIMEERVASIGRRSSYERLAHIIIELYLRLELIGEAANDIFTLPATQEHLADLLGLTNIHVSRILRRLRQDGLVAFEGRVIRILNRKRLMQAADFDPQYLIHGPSILWES
ncbi:MAG: Crp/Fnr family transcriptional regulator [Proteobacteria bacterium]|nr:Crp/Fnr family transcriptional regulator [Pseudomonadota bacterium]